MTITKLGHCCLLLEEQGARLLTDPGLFTRESHEQVRHIDAVLITHEHADHFHSGSLRTILAANPGVRVLCNTGVGRILSQEGIDHEVLEDGAATDVKGVSVTAAGRVHATIHASLPLAENTGFFIAGKLWYPGDAFTQISGAPAIVALPIAGPWMKISEAIDYAIAQKPELCIPVHDHVLSDDGRAVHERVIGSVLDARGIRFLPLEIGKEYQL